MIALTRVSQVMLEVEKYNLLYNFLLQDIGVLICMSRLVCEDEEAFVGRGDIWDV